MVSVQKLSKNQKNINISFSHNRPQMHDRPTDYEKRIQEHDHLQHNNFVTKTKIKIENGINTPEYAYRGMKGDPDFNFYEYLKVSKIPYYIGGLGLAGVCLAGKNKMFPSDAKANHQIFKKVLTGVLAYYIAKEIANAVINVPVKLFRGIDLNMPYRKITALREGNPMNLPNNKKPSNQGVFESTEFTRWDLLYEYGKDKQINETFDKLAKKFGAQHSQKDSDSKIMLPIRKLMIMATSWKYMLSVPFVAMGLGMANQQAFENTDVRSCLRNMVNFFKPSTENRFIKLTSGIKHNILKPVGNSFIELWKGNSTASQIFGRTAIITSVALPILANAMILAKTSVKKDIDKMDGAEQS